MSLCLTLCIAGSLHLCREPTLWRDGPQTIKWSADVGGRDLISIAFSDGSATLLCAC